MGNSISQHQLTAFLSLKAGQFFVGVQSSMACAEVRCFHFYCQFHCSVKLRFGVKSNCQLSLVVLFSLIGEIMKKVKFAADRGCVPAVEWVRQRCRRKGKACRAAKDGLGAGHHVVGKA